jgi:hypothetical protein
MNEQQAKLLNDLKLLAANSLLNANDHNYFQAGLKNIEESLQGFAKKLMDLQAPKEDEKQGE